MDNSQHSEWIKKIVVLMCILLLLIISVLVYIRVRTEKDNAPIDSGAIFGGRLEYGYEFAGYVISDLGDTLKICSAILVSPTQAITAAHCLDNSGDKFIAIGSYTSDRSSYHKVAKSILHPEWLNGNKVQDDMAIAIIEDPINISTYAELSAPETSCNYVVVGYGKQDTSPTFTPLRKSTDVCIESTQYLGNTISFSGREGGLCFGDSGSGIFEKGTNKFITVASSIDSCYINNFAVGAQIYGKIDLEKSTISDFVDTQILCGYVDIQNNKIIDVDDYNDFVKVYLKTCSDTKSLSTIEKCGPKDTNQDNVIDLVDFSNFAKLYAKRSCE